MPAKWIIKKAARKAVILGTIIPQLVLGALWRQRPRVRILTYHRFGDVPHDPFCVEPEAFADQMRWIADQGICISLDDLAGFLRSQRPVPDGAVLITIDDGYRSTYDIALPILEQYGLPAVSYISAGILDGSLDRHAGHEPYMAIEEIRQLPSRGMAVGSHGLSHRSMARMTDAEMSTEAERSRSILEAKTGTQVRSFAYPFGTVADFSPASEAALGRAGYDIALTSQHAAVTAGSPPLSLPRIKIERGESIRYFKMICRGGLDAWKYVDRLLYKLQKPVEPN